MSTCCISICPNSNVNGKSSELINSSLQTSVTFHHFPENEIQRSLWLDALAITNQTRFRWKTKQVCSNHFLPSDLISKDEGIILAEGAIPSICDDDDTMHLVEDNGDLLRISQLTNEFCRLCFNKHAKLFPLNARIHNLDLAEIIYLVSGVQIRANENLPNKICPGCITKVDFAYNIRREFQMHAEKLRRLLKENRLISYFERYDSTVDVSNERKVNFVKSIIQSNREALSEHGVIEISKDNSAHNTVQERSRSDVDCGMEEQFDNVEHLVEHDMDDREGLVNECILAADDLEAFGNNVCSNANFHLERNSDDARKVKKSTSSPELIKQKKSSQTLKMPELVPNNCYVCNQAFTSAQVLEEHLTSHVDMLPYKCEQCSIETNPIVLKGMVSLNRHLQSHLYPYICTHCPQRFCTEYGRYSHIRWIHRNFQKDGFTCESCGKAFDKKRTFLAHALKHRVQTEKRFKCEQCCKVFSTKVSLQRHIRTHTGECPYECPYCGKRFNHQYNFRQHKLLHFSGRKSYHCEHCPKVFVRLTTLRQHIQEHFLGSSEQNTLSDPTEPQEAAFFCQFCTEQFADAESRSDHEYTQHSTHQEILETIELVSKEEIEQLVSAGFDLEQRMERIVEPFKL
ncbi:zinc finger protein 99-like [Malaya genurostris]|uniref:zinc finger protein 99-like n=1 Tax=Malaya genurostris TaxID=325434 RepID=UPI0026F38EFC|nr:zinc finger protein 99-like [Malaya genurostris]